MTHGHQDVRKKIGKLKTTSEQAKKSQTNTIGHRSKWWLIETSNDEEGGEYGLDYQDVAPLPTPKCGKFMTISQNDKCYAW